MMFKSLRNKAVGRGHMGITLKTPAEVEEMRVAGQLAGEVLRMIREHVQPGVTTGELDRICHQYITEHQDAIPCLSWLQGISQVNLHLGQSRGLPRHPG